jgi:hypothetical protein
VAIVGGQPFQLPALLALWPNACIITEVAFGANLAADPTTWTWTDVTSSVMYDGDAGITISPMGYSDETHGGAQPAGCSLKLLNPSGDFTPYRPQSIYWPSVVQNTPLRVRINLTGLSVDTKILFQGYVNGWVPSWDDSASLATVAVSASGVTRRLGLRKTPTASPMDRTISAASPVAWWPLEDGTAATTFSSGLVSGTPATVSGQIQFGAVTTLPGAAAEAQMTGTSYAYFPVSGTFSNNWQVDFYHFLTAFPAAETTIMRVYTSGSSIVRWDFNFEPAGYEVFGYNSSGTVVYDSLLITGGLLNQWANRRIMCQASGPDINIRFDEFSLDGHSGGFIQDPVSGVAPGNVIAVEIPTSTTLAQMVYSQLAVYNNFNFTATHDSGWGYFGENAVTRLQRLAGEASVPLTVSGTSPTSMGSQSYGKRLDVLRECETADGGALLDGFGPGLLYVTRGQRYNQTAAITLDASANPPQLAPPFQPKDDDQGRVNLYKATRLNGGSATYEQTTGPLGTDTIGVFEGSGTFNVSADTQLPDRASWYASLGSYPGFRYPTLTLYPGVIASVAAGVIAMLPGARVDATNITSRATQAAPGDVHLIAEGWSHQISPVQWVMTLNCSLYDPWAAGVLDTAGYLDCGGSTTNTTLTTTATALQVLITDLCAWTHADGDYDIVVNGERMTVTAVGSVSGTIPSRTQTLTVTRSVNGVVKSHVVGEPVNVAVPFILAL